MLITPDWPAPANIRAVSTTRLGGGSLPPYDSFNLATHVGDDTTSVKINRQLLKESANLPQEPLWLSQTHSTDVIRIGRKFSEEQALGERETPQADASVSSEPGHICVVMTADCLPILLTNNQGSQVAAIHAGWRGLADGIIEKVIKQYFRDEQILAWLGPAISVNNFEVGAEVKDAFVKNDNSSEVHFEKYDQKFKANLYGIAKDKLKRFGSKVFGGNFCTYAEDDRFFSYRRNSVTGRMATLIWIDKE
ncbi:MAG: peptidoglycan editing factor PgeF [Gammaproteobacteria bacterium]|nr:peptidoglycan editing factor PgeF [Gammaproteobacteria bacterium]